MRLQTVPARHGARWLREGMRTFFMRPMAFAAMTGVVVFVLLVVKLLPMLVFFVLPLAPLVTLAFMLATRMVREGGAPTLGVFAVPLRAERPRVVALLRLGLVYAVATFAIMGLGELIGGGDAEVTLDAPSTGASGASAAGGAQTAPTTASTTAPTTTPTVTAPPGAAFGLALQLALAGLLSVPFWHAPALVYWEGQGCAQALFSSTLACWRNWRAFIVYGVAGLGCVMGLSLAVGLLVALVGRAEWLVAASAPLSLIVAALFYPSLWFTYVDCFAPSSTDKETTP
jgi:hypothetical protein